MKPSTYVDKLDDLVITDSEYGNAFKPDVLTCRPTVWQVDGDGGAVVDTKRHMAGPGDTVRNRLFPLSENGSALMRQRSECLDAAGFRGNVASDPVYEMHVIGQAPDHAGNVEIVISRNIVGNDHGNFIHRTCSSKSLRRVFYLSCLTFALSACATTQKPPEIAYDDAVPAVQTVDPPSPVTVVELPRPLPLPGQMKPVEETRRAPEPTDPAARVNQANAAARIQPVRDGFINAMQVYPYTGGALYQVYTAVGQITDIALQPGETLVGSGPVAPGDTVRWIIGDTLSGSGATQQVHILVKPTRPELMTNLIINTNMRTYHMELRSTERTYMASVSWQYPQDQLIVLRRQNSQAEAAQPIASGVDLANVNFRYAIEGDRAPWRPLRAFDDGRQVFIEFPRGIAQGEMPPLFVVGPEGNTSELVNYRVRGRHMIVDRLFAAAELRFGTGDTQRRVRITRTDGRPAS